MIAGYVVLDGLRPGRGPSFSVLSRAARSRSGGVLLASIGPVWDGNEVVVDCRGRNAVLCISGIVFSGGSAEFYLAVDDGVVAADSARHFELKLPQAISKSAIWKAFLGLLFGADRARCWPCFMGPRWATWCGGRSAGTPTVSSSFPLWT